MNTTADLPSKDMNGFDYWRALAKLIGDEPTGHRGPLSIPAATGSNATDCASSDAQQMAREASHRLNTTLRDATMNTAINEATHLRSDKLFQLAHGHGEPDGTVVIEHIGTVWAGCDFEARQSGALLFFLPFAQLQAWEIIPPK